jgi:hypothetical protein
MANQDIIKKDLTLYLDNRLPEGIGPLSNKVGTLSMKITPCIECAFGALKYMNYLSWERVNNINEFILANKDYNFDFFFTHGLLTH